MMALPQTPEQATIILEAWRKSPKGKLVHDFYNSDLLRAIEDVRKNPTPHKVFYDYGKPIYISPREFLFVKAGMACEWIVPGTLKDTSDL